MLRLALPALLCLCACGGVTDLDNLPPTSPTITAFAAAPASLPAGGGAAVLSWTVVNQDQLSLSPGNHDVTGFTSANVTPTVTTLYTLTAGNSLGYKSSNLTITVGP